MHFNYRPSPVTVIIGLIVMVTAGYLCWNCNSTETTAKRVIYTIFAAVFGWIYLIYYLVYRILMGHKCHA